MLLQVLALLQQLTAVPSKALMRDACTALLAQPVADGVATRLSAALQQLDLEGEQMRHNVSCHCKLHCMLCCMSLGTGCMTRVWR